MASEATYIPSAMGEIGGTIATCILEVWGFGYAPAIRPTSNEHFMYVSVYNSKSDRYFRLLVSHSRDRDVRHSLKYIRKRAAEGSTVYIIPFDKAGVHPYDYECIMDLLSPAARNNIIRQQMEFMSTLERLDPAGVAAAPPTFASPAHDDVCYF